MFNHTTGTDPTIQHYLNTYDALCYLNSNCPWTVRAHVLQTLVDGAFPATRQSTLGDFTFLVPRKPGTPCHKKCLRCHLCHHSDSYCKPSFSTVSPVLINSQTFLRDISVYFWQCSVVLQCLRLHHVNPLTMTMMTNQLCVTTVDTCTPTKVEGDQSMRMTATYWTGSD